MNFGVGIYIGPLSSHSQYAIGIIQYIPTQTAFNAQTLYEVQEIVTRSQYNIYCFYFLSKDVVAMLK
jgi:hypothetical protein